MAQTAEILRKYVATRPAGEKLASERELGHQLGVSRMTLRAALGKLERERLIRAGQGRSRVIVKRGRHARKSSGPRDVVLLSPIPLHEIEPRVLLSMNELHDMLAQEQHQLKFVVPHNCYRERPQRDLKELAARLHPSAWVLLLSTRAMQEWFQDQGLPAVVAKPCARATAFMAPALVPLIPSIITLPSSSSVSSTPQVKAPCDPPPCKARLM